MFVTAIIKNINIYLYIYIFLTKSSLVIIFENINYRKRQDNSPPCEHFFLQNMSGGELH